MISNEKLKKGCFPFTILLVVLTLFFWRKCAYQNFESVEFKGS